MANIFLPVEAKLAAKSAGSEQKKKMDVNPILLKSFAAGAFSGTCSTILFQPLDLMKTRLQNTQHIRTPQPIGFVTVFSDVLRNGNIFSFWKGMSASLARCVPGVGIYFSSVHWLTTKFTSGQPKPLEAVCIGIVARSVSGICLLPFTVVKTRFESGVYQYNSVAEALRKIYATEGTRGLFSGLTATLVRDAPFSGLYLMMYTTTKQHIPQKWKKTSFISPIYFLCGIFSGCSATLLTHPADVIKTQLQLHPDRFNGIQSVVVYIYKTRGIPGYFSGLVPRMLRRSLMSAMAWMVYEKVMMKFGLK